MLKPQVLQPTPFFLSSSGGLVRLSYGQSRGVFFPPNYAEPSRFFQWRLGQVGPHPRLFTRHFPHPLRGNPFSPVPHLLAPSGLESSFGDFVPPGFWLRSPPLLHKYTPFPRRSEWRNSVLSPGFFFPFPVGTGFVVANFDPPPESFLECFSPQLSLFLQTF